MKHLLLSFVTCLILLQSCSVDSSNPDLLSPDKEDMLSQETDLFIDQKEAEILSNQFVIWNEKIETRGIEKQILNTSVVQSEDVSYDALMYIINYTDGFTVISATKGIYPILAYSDKGSLNIDDTTNIGLSIWIDCMKKDIAIEMNKPSNDPYKLEKYNYLKTQFAESKKVDISTRAPIYIDEIRNYVKVGPHLITEWDQGDPYNKYIPNKYPAGCVPVAIAQVVNYHRRLNGENIDFTATNNGNNDAIAKLIAKIGSGIDMVYKKDGSYPDYCLNPFNLFCYRGRIENYLNARGYIASYTDNFNKKPTTVPAIYEAYKEGFLGITALGKGHTWVMDGYESYDIYQGWFELPEVRSSYEPGRVWGVLYLHFNWGWKDGYQNGWYGVSSSYLDYSNSAKRLEIRKR